MADKRIADDYEYINSRMQEIAAERQYALQSPPEEIEEQRIHCEQCGRRKPLNKVREKLSRKWYYVCRLCIFEHREVWDL